MKRIALLTVMALLAMVLTGCWGNSPSVEWSMEDFLQAWLDGDAQAMAGFFEEQVLIGFKTAPDTPEYEDWDDYYAASEPPSSIILHQETHPAAVALALFTHPQSLAYFGDYPDLIEHDIEHTLEDYEVFWADGFSTNCIEGTEGYALMAVNLQGDSRIVRVEFRLRRAEVQPMVIEYPDQQDWRIYEVWFIVGGEPADEEPEEPEEPQVS